MDASERVTWERCPDCGRPAAVGWLDDVPVEFDCTGGCAPKLEEVRALTGLRPANKS